MSKKNRRVTYDLGNGCSYEYGQLMSSELSSAPYQRPVDANRVKKIAEDFDPRLVNCLKVSKRDGKFYVFDGAHTLAALKMVKGNTPFKVDCKIFNNLSYEDEAYLFALQSGNSKEVAFNYRLKAMLISNSEEALAFRKHTENTGLCLSENGCTASKNTIAALAKAYKLYEKFGWQRYEDILNLIHDTWNGEKWSLSGYMLGGVSVFLNAYAESFSRDRFIKRLAGVDYEALRATARQMSGRSADVAHAIAIAKAYNRSGGKKCVDLCILTILD